MTFSASTLRLMYAVCSVFANIKIINQGKFYTEGTGGGGGVQQVARKVKLDLEFRDFNPVIWQILVRNIQTQISSLISRDAGEVRGLTRRGSRSEGGHGENNLM